MIDKGDIVRVQKSIFCDFPGGNYCDHWVKKNVLLLVRTMPTNNGNMICEDSKGHKQHVNQIEVLEVFHR